MFVLHRTDFQHTLREEAISRRREIYTFLRSGSIFELLNDRQLSRVADVVEEESFTEGQVVFKEGEKGLKLYIVKEGQVVIKQALPEEERTVNAKGKEESKLIGILKAGDYFGERALLTDEPRSATIEAVGSAVCLSIDSESFTSLLGSVCGPTPLINEIRGHDILARDLLFHGPWLFGPWFLGFWCSWPWPPSALHPIRFHPPLSFASPSAGDQAARGESSCDEPEL